MPLTSDSEWHHRCVLMADLYKELGNRGNEMENAEYERDKEDDLQKRLSEAQSSAHHLELVYTLYCHQHSYTPN